MGGRWRVRLMLGARTVCCGSEGEVWLMLEVRAACCGSEDEGEADAGGEGCVLWDLW